MIGPDLLIPTRALMRSPPPGLNLDFASGVYRLDGADASSFGAVPGATFSRTGAGTALTLGGAVIAFASGVPRITDKGFLLEEARTNSIRNSVLAGATIGSPGAPPTNWSINAGAAPGTIVTSISGTGTQSGLAYMDVRFQGVAGGAATNTSIEPETNVQVVAANADAWTASIFIALVGGSLPAGACNLNIHERTSAGAQIGVGAINIRSLITGVLQRFSQTRTLGGGAAVARISMSIRADVAASEAVDFTLRIAQPDLQLGAYLLSPILTTGVAATRGIDTAYIDGLGSIMSFPCAFSVHGDTGGVAAALSAVTDGTAANAFVFGRSSGSANVQIISGGGQTTSAIAGGIGAGQNTALVARLTGSGGRAYRDGSNQTDITRALAAVSRLNIGFGTSGASIANGYLQRVRILPGDLSDAQLQALTQ
jgi:hypothetical protein